MARLHAVLVDHRLAVPRQIRRRLAFSRRGIHVGRQATRRRRTGEQATVLGAADGDRTSGQVRQHRRTRERRFRARRYRHEHVLADLDMKNETGKIRCGEQQIGSERHLGDGRAAAHADDPAHVIARRHLTTLVELPVGRQVRLRHNAEHLSSVDDDGGVVDAVAVAQRRTDNQDREQVGRCRPRCPAARPRRRRAAHPASRCPRWSSPTA